MPRTDFRGSPSSSEGARADGRPSCGAPYRVAGALPIEEAPAPLDTLDQRIVPMLTIGFLVPIEVAAGRADRWGTAAAFAFCVSLAALLVRRLAR